MSHGTSARRAMGFLLKAVGVRDPPALSSNPSHQGRRRQGKTS
jgi:hypothetical protein